MTDYGGLPAGELDAAVRAMGIWLDAGERIYLHCRAGWQRSAAVAAGVVAVRTGVGIDEALDRVRRCKPTADPMPHQREDLRRWWESRAVAREPESRRSASCLERDPSELGGRGTPSDPGRD